MNEPIKKQPVTKPVFTFDVAIINRMNNIISYVEDNKHDFLCGDLNAVLGWKAGMQILWPNIKRFCTDANGVADIEKNLKVLDDMINPVHPVENFKPEELDKIYGILKDLDILIEIFSEVFMKTTKFVSSAQKFLEYETSSLPEKERMEEMKTLEVPAEDTMEEVDYEEDE